jgi:hypothetical protein
MRKSEIAKTSWYVIARKAFARTKQSHSSNYENQNLRLPLLTLVFIFLSIPFQNSNAQNKDSVTPPLDEYRHFIMPTAKPIHGGYFGFWELAFLQGGVGFGDIVSFSGGITLLPTVAVRSQFGFLQGKVTLADENGISFAAGANLLRLTSEHLYLHLFATGTMEMQNETRYTGMIFLKASGPDFPVVNVYPFGSFSFTYGSVLGAGIGFDTPIKGIPNTRLLAEIWNHDLSSVNKFALLFAARIESERFSSDFGFMYFSLPLLAPVANFVWRF